MDPLTVSIIVFDVGLILLLKVVHGRRSRPSKLEADASRFVPAKTAFEEAAESLGLENQRRGLSFVLRGTLDGFRVHIEPLGLMLSGEGSSADLRVSLDAEQVLRGDLLLSSRSKKPPSPDDKPRRITTGDEGFDLRYEVNGPESFVRALLGRRHRKTLLALAGHLTVRDGRIIYTARGLDRGGAGISEIARDATSLARSLLLEQDAVLEQLALNVAEDPVPGVRFNSLSIMVREFRPFEETTAACRRALEDEDPQVRLEAAIALGPDGLPVCVALARSLNAIPAHVRVRALRHLSRRLPVAEALPLLDEALGDPSVDVRVDAIRCLGLLRSPAAVHPLIRQLRSSTRQEAEAIAAALGQCGGEEAETVLVRLLSHDWPEVKGAAVLALTKSGTAEAIPALQELGKDRSASAPLRRAAEEAVLEIRSRTQAEPGRLSLAGSEAEAGGLSYAGAEQGSLSPAKPATADESD